MSRSSKLTIVQKRVLRRNIENALAEYHSDATSRPAIPHQKLVSALRRLVQSMDATLSS